VRQRTRQGGSVKGVWVGVGGGGLMTPYEALVLDYPKLGMQTIVQDVSLKRAFILPDHRYSDPRPLPLAAAFADPGLVSTPGGGAVFPLLPPGMRSLPVAGGIATFAGDHGPRLLAHAETPASPGDTLWSDIIVLDSTENVVARSSAPLGPSACDPGG